MKVLFTIFKPNGYIWLQEEMNSVPTAALRASDFLYDQPEGYRVEIRIME